MYTTINFKSKKELKAAVANGRQIGVYQPNDMFGIDTLSLKHCSVEGPHYPQPHKWYASVILEDGFIKKVN
jgi:hypothetical protein